ncbi:MAG: hypothetical protein OEV49_02965 [candidate division Zixibacteria bacterium]|nr:hypothetical protein [candidate division Zixibacteria bacterium]MDH3938134.1 hypothetical protein [candidate division Zixibacteria bacterium]MDH4033557.1 hypothetical protein [candidate division Zixibacteria bacterium]
MTESEHRQEGDTEGEKPLTSLACDCTASDSSCCTDGTGKPPGRSWGKTLVASVVLVAAVAAAGYSIIRDNSDSTEPADPTGAAAPCSTANSGCAPSLFGLGGDSTISPVAVAVLTGVVSDVEVAFVLLTGSDNDAAQNAAAELERVVDNLRAQGKTVKPVAFVPGSPGYVGLVQLGRVESFPTLAALGSKGAYTFLAPDEISELKLLRAFVVASTPVPGCAPGSPGCAPPAGAN